VFDRIETAKKTAIARATATNDTDTTGVSRETPHASRAASIRSSAEIPTGPRSSRPISRVDRSTSSRKRERSPSLHYTTAQTPLHHSPSPTLKQRSHSIHLQLNSQERDAIMDKYIALQAQEEELDSGICDAENERSDIAAQIVGLQARLNEAEETKSELMRETHNTRAEKKRLQSSLDLEEQLEFGFEAGRKMESKRVKMARGGRRSGRAWSSFWVRWTEIIWLYRSHMMGVIWLNRC
jgi:hypothetical protein